MKNKKLKVMTVVGTRPEIIRLSRVIPQMDRYFHHIFVYTNQNYSFELSRIFFKDFNLRKPDYLLSVKSKTLGGQIGNILKQTEEVMIKEQPDALLVLGDTNSALSTVISKRRHIPVFHMEAGNRAFDWDVPEEVNRRIVDHISDYNLAYTEHARRYLIQEGIHPGTIYVTGSPLAEVFEYYRNQIESSSILKKLSLTQEKYFVMSTHREENIDNETHMRELFQSLNHLVQAYGIPVILSTHPRTKGRLKELGIKLHLLIRIHKPFGFFDYVKLQKKSLCVLSDSGSIQEESSMLGFRAIQIRKSSERPEAFDTGSIILTGFNKDTIINAVRVTVDEYKSGTIPRTPFDYRDKNVSMKVVKLILGLAGIRRFQK